MGQDESSVSMLKSESFEDIQEKNNSKSLGYSNIPTNKMRSQCFSASWSILYPTSIAPTPRHSHFTVYNSKSDISIIGYGLDSNGHHCHDIWAINFITFKWNRLNINLNSISPRYGSTSVLINNKIYIFGGQNKNNYFSDLHIINLDTLNIEIPHIEGNQPIGRVGHAMGTYNNKIVIWGGNNEQILEDFWEFDINKLNWNYLKTDFSGRTQTAFSVLNDTFYISCSSTSDSIYCYRFTDNHFDSINVTGNPPPFELKNSSLVSIDRYLILIGGKMESQNFTMVRAFDTIRKWWFIFHIIPDGETTTLADGNIDQNGIFMVPRTSSSSMIYRNKERQIIIYLGQPVIEPPPLFVLNIGESLSYLHLQNDLFEMLFFKIK